jgi:hypothetical protein
MEWWPMTVAPWYIRWWKTETIYSRFAVRANARQFLNDPSGLSVNIFLYFAEDDTK